LKYASNKTAIAKKIAGAAGALRRFRHFCRPRLKGEGEAKAAKVSLQAAVVGGNESDNPDLGTGAWVFKVATVPRLSWPANAAMTAEV
jgi:hypothetical protein